MSRTVEYSKVAALILARGGSKGVPLKNIKNLCGHPLIAWAINACTKAKGVDDVWVSTDSDLIAEEARKCGALVHQRAPYTATDEAPSMLGVREFIQAHPEYEFIGLVQATSPMILPEFVDSAVEKMKCGDWDSALVPPQSMLIQRIDLEDKIGLVS
ncbi:unnamed protein product [Notodromas monacha]|uniref:N-acylneuraminate cytidylyltransferase n=1 Tax=Notodromas monacha TaxID=399045 RepID=A0A7R9BD18_9CRUS|nr:unnamed protein product [Notodromas monacha]CAG0913111.1 unnamed protein product [Notodromas monacha]